LQQNHGFKVYFSCRQEVLKLNKKSYAEKEKLCKDSSEKKIIKILKRHADELVIVYH
jgi:hypothetical protein